MHADDLERITVAAFAALKGTTPEYSVEHRIRTASGAWKWIHSHGMVTERSADGRAVRMTGTNADIDERKRAEEAVASAERRLREVTDGLPARCISSSGSRARALPRINFVSAGVAEMLGVEPESVVEDSGRLFGAVAAEDRAHVLDTLQEAHAQRGDALDGRLPRSPIRRTRGVDAQPGQPRRRRHGRRLERLLGGHQPARRSRAAAARRARPGRTRQPREDRVPGGDEP